MRGGGIFAVVLLPEECLGGLIYGCLLRVGGNRWWAFRSLAERSHCERFLVCVLDYIQTRW